MTTTDSDPLAQLVGKTVTKIQQDNEHVIFHTQEGPVYAMYHRQDCCESVTLEDIDGDLEDLLGLIVQAETCSDSYIEALRLVDTSVPRREQDEEPFTWTFYRISSNRGGVMLRWLGSSNGYYSEEVSFEQVDTEDEYCWLGPTSSEIAHVPVIAEAA